MKEERHVIWSNYGLDYEDWRDDLEADYPDLSEDERISLMYEINGDYLDDERANLNVQLSQPILVVGDLGLWNGRRMGYKEIPSGNIRDCLYSDTDYSTWYVDRLGDLRCDAIHHDGTNFYLYRVYKDSASPSQIELLKEKLYRGIATRADITRVTRRLGEMAQKLIDQFMRYGRPFVDSDHAPCVALRMYPKEAGNTIWLLLLSLCNQYDPDKDYSAELKAAKKE